VLTWHGELRRTTGGILNRIRQDLALHDICTGSALAGSPGGRLWMMAVEALGWLYGGALYQAIYIHFGLNQAIGMV